MKTILFLSKAPAIELIPYFEGINAVSLREHWNLQRIGGTIRTKDVKEILAFWKPHGCIVQCATEADIFPHELFARIPHVFIDKNPAHCKKNDLCVLHDSAAAGRLAARELLSLHLENFAYVRADSANPFWCKERREAFSAALKMNGVGTVAISDAVDSERNATHRELANWLKGLPLPVGIFAANDRTAELVLSAAKELGLSVPDDIAVIGVDNCEGICENASPTLTSVAPEFVQAGRNAAELLARRLADPKLKGVTVRYGQSGVVRRESTQRLVRKDARVSRILEHIRVHAADESLTFEQLAEVAGCTLRCAEMQFRKLLGRTILDELHEQRVEIAKRLLRKSNVRISEAARKSGFSSLATFARVFAHQTGTSPRIWRAGRDRQKPDRK